MDGQQAPIQNQNMQAPEIQKDKSGMAVAGFILAFLIPIVGIVLSVIGLKSRKHGLAIAGIIVSVFMMVVQIAVFGILFGLTSNSVSDVQETNSDIERRTDVNSLSTLLEVYYNQHGHYPETFTAGELPGADAESFYDPDGNPIAMGTEGVALGYYYQPSECVENECQQFVIGTTLTDGSKYEKDSLN